MPPETDIRRLLEENLSLSKQNNELLHKLHRMEMYSFWIRALWIGVLIGVPFLIYYFFLEPYVTALGLNSEEFKASIKNLPHLINTPWGSLVE